MSNSSWSDLVTQLGGDQVVLKLSQALQSDQQFLAFTDTDALASSVTFGIKSTESERAILVTVCNDSSYASGKASDNEPLFTIAALPEQWERFFRKIPQPGFQSFWGMLRYSMNGKNGAKILGSQVDFARHAHIVRRVLELLHEIHCGKTGEPLEDNEETEEQDFIQGHYIFLTLPLYGRCKIFVEQSGTGTQDLLFLHTAGADSRQYHALMNDASLLPLYKMTAFDLPSHGRSFPSPNLLHGNHTLTEDAYIATIAAVIRAERLSRPVVVGASMAGQVCLAIAIRNAEVQAGGVVPLEACEHIARDRQWQDKSPLVNGSLFNPEAIYGLCAPTAPAANKRLVWHMYSGQAYGVFHGDLDFYNGGWDGRGRVGGIDGAECPVFMLTGEYDYSTSPEMSRETAGRIPGARFEVMRGLGHFPATENPEAFKPYLMKAVEWIQAQRKGQDLS
ncbi:alpha/beta hydrolase-like protein [Viridothelium virens]|uniref:Alpha/beta hydrolase-like protein n=1 Tax=Viridothelium virens TaxID=1048519 RepID=A0A6A6HNI2_VIRVR|nr:alpha/beta hydrolase-like protein [Viridothelium virens]